MTVEGSRRRVVRALAAAGCVAPAEEAEELILAADEGVGTLDELLARRLRGEPLAWITGSAPFCGMRILVGPGVYVPRPQTEALARRAASLLPPDGIGVDLCTGSGAVARVLGRARPRASVVATDIDPTAVACATRNGVTAFLGDLDDPLPPCLRRRVDVMTAVVPYVPTEELHLLPKDVVAYEPRRALEGGTAVLKRAAEASAGWLRPDGSVLLELGGDQASELASILAGVGLSDVRVHRDRDGRDRAIVARRPR